MFYLLLYVNWDFQPINCIILPVNVVFSLNYRFGSDIFNCDIFDHIFPQDLSKPGWKHVFSSPVIVLND